MDSANDSPGLKIAVAAFITISVMLGVTSYFLYSSLASVKRSLIPCAMLNSLRGVRRMWL